MAAGYDAWRQLQCSVYIETSVQATNESVPVNAVLTVIPNLLQTKRTWPVFKGTFKYTFKMYSAVQKSPLHCLGLTFKV